MGNVQSGKQSLTDVEVSAKTLKLKLTEVREHLTVALNDAATSAGKGKQAVTPAAKDISAALNATNAALQTVTRGAPQTSVLWVYLSTQNGSAWNTRNFDLTALLKSA